MQILVFEKTLKFVDSIMAPTNKQLDNFSTHKKLCFTPEDFNLLHEDVFFVEMALYHIVAMNERDQTLTTNSEIITRQAELNQKFCFQKSVYIFLKSK